MAGAGGGELDPEPGRSPSTPVHASTDRRQTRAKYFLRFRPPLSQRGRRALGDRRRVQARIGGEFVVGANHGVDAPLRRCYRLGGSVESGSSRPDSNAKRNSCARVLSSSFSWRRLR